MSQPYVGEIRIFAASFAPAGWKLCNGEQLAIAEYETLFQLIGTTYGGDGQSTFALPDLQSRVPVHQGKGASLPSTRIIGETGGTETVTLSTQQIPIHTHPFIASGDAGSQTSPANATIGSASNVSVFRPGAANQPFDPSAIAPPVGGSQPHDNMQPYLCMNYIISLFGIFPSQL